MWANGATDDCLRHLRQFTASVNSDLIAESEQAKTNVPKQKYEELSRLLARCYYKQGQWHDSLKGTWTAVSILSLPL